MQTDAANLNLDQPTCYRICVQGVLPASWVDYFGEVTLVNNPDAYALGITILRTPALDQAALLGILIQLSGMGLPLRSVEWLEQEPAQSVGPICA